MTLFHPREVTLNRFVDGELSERNRRRVTRHLATCVQCRRTVVAIRALVNEASSIPNPPVPRDLLWRILHASTDGQGAILPDPLVVHSVNQPPRERAWKKRTIVSAAALALMVMAARNVASESTYFALSSPRPHAGEQLTVRYKNTTAIFSDSLVLRAEVVRYGRPNWDDGLEYLVLDTLIRSSGGEYRGRFRWPNNVAFATVGVEYLDGKVVDTDRNTNIPLVLHVGGVPTLDGLTQQLREYFRRGWSEAGLEVARITKGFYEMEPAVWGSEYAAAVQHFGMRARDSLLVTHLPKFHEMARDTSRYNSPEWVSEMSMWAFSMDTVELTSTWQNLLRMRAPFSPIAVSLQADEIGSLDISDAEKYQRYEALWEAYGQREPIARHVYFKAIQERDGQHAVKWAQRFLGFNPDRKLSVARRLLDNDAARPFVLHLLETTLAELDSVRLDQSGLRVTVLEHLQQRAAEKRRATSLLVQALVKDGRPLEALSYVEQAVQTGWDTEAFGLGAKLRLAFGDSLRAAELFARLYVDAAATGKPGESIDALGNRMAGANWPNYKNAAESRMFEQVMREAIDLPPKPDSVIVDDPEGASSSLASLWRDKPTVVAFVWKEQEPTIDSLVELAASIDPRETDIIVMTNDLSDQSDREHIDGMAPLQFYRDRGAEAARYFRTTRTPDFYVVDSASHLYFHTDTLLDVRRQLAMLQRLRTVNDQAFVAP